MTKPVFFLCLIALALASALLTSAAKAEPVPEYVLDKDFMSCMGGDSPQKDPQRAEYCNCIRDSMRGWDMETYGAVASAESKATNSQQVPQQIAEIARACIAKVLK